MAEHASERPAAWLAGAAEIDVTPPLGVDMTGYAGRPGPADHILDRLYVRALALQACEGEPVVLTCGDLLGLSRDSIGRVRSLVADRVPPERLLLNHSHTHAGPTVAGLRAMGSADPSYVDLVERWTASAVREALRRLAPARVRFGTSSTGIGRNRREQRAGRTVIGSDPGGAYDPTVSVLRVEDPGGRPLASWFSHGTHPVVMAAENTGLSAEWPGAAARVLARELGCPAVFSQGCCGDINPVRRGGWDVVLSVGRELGGAALAAWERAEIVEPSGTAAALETVLLPQRAPTTAEAEEAASSARERLAAAGREVGDSPSAVEVRRKLEPQRAMVAWSADYLAAARAGTAPPVEMDVQAIRLGDVLLLATGAETFVEIGQEMRRRSGAARSVALGYTNGCFGYLPTAAAFPQGGYEVDGAFRYYGTLMVTPDCERLTLEAAERVSRAVGRLEG